MSAAADFETRHGFCSVWGKNIAFCVYSVHVKNWCAANSNLAYFIELTTALECQKQLLMSSISNLGGRESLEIAVNEKYENIKFQQKLIFSENYVTETNRGLAHFFPDDFGVREISRLVSS